MKEFKSKRGNWIVGITYFASVICLYGVFRILSESTSTESLFLAILLLLIGFFFPIWLLVSLRFKVNQESLKITCGPFRWSIPLDEIKSVKPSRLLASAAALSLDRLLITYGNGNVVLVSPTDKRGFIYALGKSEIK
ncbi:hypothetical protein BK026_16980 [Alteromonas sp. V450]|uniref:PH domain-containing protein n=1 Tax=Alteromonas sp. V450 TaxID=1912139 RepID=UPI0008FF3D9C|nr:hypothetical protein BK026_16980 [Alteromonas sp. V450]